MSVASIVLLAFLACAPAQVMGVDVNDEACNAGPDGSCTSLLQTEIRKRTTHVATHEHSKALPHLAAFASGRAAGPNNLQTQTTVPAASAETPPVSTTMKCVSCLVLQFFVVYTGLAVSRTITMFTEGGVLGSAAAEKIFEGAKKTVNLAPPVSVLFVATRMRALQLSDDDPDKYGLPQSWCQWGMVACTLSIAWGTIMHFVSGISHHMPKLPTEGTAVASMVTKVLDLVQYAALLGLYVGAGVVTAGLLTMDRPAELGGEIPVSDASKCTITLTIQYFVVYLALKVSDTVDLYTRDTAKEGPSHITEVLDMAQHTIVYAPMLAILFMAARMRAIQLDPEGAPQAWARVCFYIATYSILAQTIIAVAVPLLLGGVARKGEVEGEVVVEVKNESLVKVLLAVRWGIMFGIHVAVAAVIVSIFTIQAPSGPTPPVSTTTGCVICMTTQFFFVFVFLWLLFTLREFSPSLSEQLKFLSPILLAAKDTVFYAPMLSVLFVGTRLRALQLSDNQGAPQDWVQACMKLSTGALLLQIVMVALTGLLTDRPLPTAEPTKTGSDGSMFGYVTCAVQYASMFAMYGGAVGVIVGLFQMTVENVSPVGA